MKTYTATPYTILQHQHVLIPALAPDTHTHSATVLMPILGNVINNVLVYSLATGVKQLPLSQIEIVDGPLNQFLAIQCIAKNLFNPAVETIWHLHKISDNSYMLQSDSGISAMLTDQAPSGLGPNYVTINVPSDCFSNNRLEFLNNLLFWTSL